MPTTYKVSRKHGRSTSFELGASYRGTVVHEKSKYSDSNKHFLKLKSTWCLVRVVFKCILQYV
eukprot:scaffold6007_cov183-Amphora_coffeaeformis.AAC.12